MSRDIEVRIDQTQFDLIGHLALRLDNLEISEEEYVDGLHHILGRSLHTKPDEGDRIHLVLDQKIQGTVH